jgi:hypothetical protein
VAKTGCARLLKHWRQSGHGRVSAPTVPPFSADERCPLSLVADGWPERQRQPPEHFSGRCPRKISNLDAFATGQSCRPGNENIGIRPTAVLAGGERQVVCRGGSPVVEGRVPPTLRKVEAVPIGHSLFLTASITQAGPTTRAEHPSPNDRRFPAYSRSSVMTPQRSAMFAFGSSLTEGPSTDRVTNAGLV